MKKLLLIATMAVLIPSLSFAQTSTTSTKDLRDDLKQRRENFQKNIQEQKDKIKEERASTTQLFKQEREQIKSAIEQRIGKKLDEKRTKIANGFEDVVKNLKSLLARVENKIASIEQKTPVATTTISLVETAKNNITLAETELTTLENKLAQSYSTSTKKAYLADIKAQSEKTKTAIKTAHKSIVDIINSLKPGLLKDRATATTTNR